jgi:short subunit dehydrogenase-like uncharacterized protein
MMRWMIYGATGFSGRLIAVEAVRRGHRPLLAGRSAAKLAPLAERLGLEYIAFDLKKLDVIARSISGFDLVFHAAGPFIHTSDPMLRACVLSGINYVDITGEFSVFENTFAYDEAARRLNLAFISGVGFDVVPSDCLASYVAAQTPNATQLEIAIAGLTSMSAGTAKSGLSLIAGGGWVRRNGKLMPYPLGTGAKGFPFPNGKVLAIPIPWGDLSTAYRSTGIPNITTYMSFPTPLIRLTRVGAPILQMLTASTAVRSLAENAVEKIVRGPDDHAHQTDRAYLWAQAADAQGNTKQAWLETVEPYRFTALSGVTCAEKLLAKRPIGALTPAQAFGADFVLEIEGTRRMDTLAN